METTTQAELIRRHRTAMLVVLIFLGLDGVLLAIAFFAGDRISRPRKAMGCGLPGRADVYRHA